MNKSYIWIQIPRTQILGLKKELPLLESENLTDIHLTIDYLWKEKIPIFWDRIVNQMKEQCADILDEELIFPRTSLMKDRYSEDILYILSCDDTSKMSLARAYDSMNISELNSNFSSADWMPHITLVRIKDGVWIRKYSERYLVTPIKLKLADIKIL